MVRSISSPAAVDGDDCSDDHRAQKRPVWDDNANDRASKRRASRACLSCRSRKVRCDVVNTRVPCTNCRLDDVECVVTESNRGKRPTTTNSAPPRPHPPLSPPAIATTVAPPPPPAPPTQSQIITPPSSNGADDYLVSLTFEDHLSATQLDDVHNSPRTQHRSTQRQQPTNMTSTNLSPALSAEQVDGTSMNNNTLRLPPYIRALPPHITARDFDYLADKDALTIPDDEFRDELLRTYAVIVHPFIPALDLNDFLGSIVTQGHNPVSLLVFQAVMFASITFVDTKFLLARGYSSRKAARKVFFDRVRLLYGLDCEPDRLALIQALLLMTYWYSCPEDEKDTWYWMGIALTLAQVAGFHLDPQNLTISAREKRLRRRIWWSCVMRDRLLALGIRRPSRIRKDEFDVPMLTLDDFDTGAPSEALAKLLGESSLAAPDPEARIVLAAICIDLAKLCVCLGHILHSQYTILGHHTIGPSSFPKIIVVPKRSEKQLQELIKCDAELGAWLQSRDARSKYLPESAQNKGDGGISLHLHQALLHMIYLTSVGVLHRPQVFHSGSEGGESRKGSKEKITEAAIAMTKLAFDLECRDQLRYLSTSSIPAFLSATLIHLLEIRSSDEEIRNISIGRFYQCIQVLHQLQDMYASADYAVRFLDMVLRITKIKIPMLRLGLSSKSRTESDTLFETSYITTPSGSRNQTSLANTLAGGQNSQQADMSQLLNPIFTSFEGWPFAGTGMSWSINNQSSTDALPASPYPGTWADVDGLVPALINFNADPSLELGEQ